MIKENEIRIGNLLQDEDDTQLYVAGIWHLENGKYHYMDSGRNTYFKGELYPVPLSDELFKQYGFVWNAELNGYEKSGWMPFHIEKRNTVYEWYFLTTFKRDWQIGKFQYLHELQNLYYSITGKELLKSDQNPDECDATEA